MGTKKNYYKWAVIGACFLMVFTVLGFCSSSKSLYIKAITNALSMPRSIFSISDSFRFVTTAIVNMFFGTLMARFGAKKLISAGFVSLILFSVLFSIGTNVWYFYIGSIFLGIGLSWTTTTMVGAIVNKWCKESKGTIMGFILSANGVGAALAVQILSPIINNPDNVFAYRNAYSLVSVILVVVGIIVVCFVKEKPKTQDEPQKAVEKKEEKKEKVVEWEGIDYSVAVKKVYFYAALLCIFLTGMMLQGLTGVSTPLMYDVGLNESYVATVLSAHSLALTVCKFGVGFMYDHLGLRRTTNVCFIAAIISIAMLAFITNSMSGQIMAMIYGVLSSLALPLETVMLSIYANDLFGQKSFNKILGLFVSVNVAGYALGAPLYNLCYDILGNYNISIYISAILMIIVFVVMQFVIKSAHKERIKA